MGKVWLLKLKAFLHDPPHKHWIISMDNEECIKKFQLQEKGRCHEILIKSKVIEPLLGEDLTEEEEKLIEKADTQAYPVNRILPPVAVKIRGEDVIFFDIFSKKIYYDILAETEYETENKRFLELIEKLATNYKLSQINKEEKAKILFLFLWRFYQKIFHWMKIHPADTRAPNHSIYDHLVQTSTLVSALPKPAFLLFTIGPVQSFIATARKTSDLWAGSYMLSYFIWESMKFVVEHYGPDVIVYPNLLGQPLVDLWLSSKVFGNSFTDLAQTEFDEWFKEWNRVPRSESLEGKLTIANMPNKFLAIVPVNEGEALKLGEECEKNFKEQLKRLAKKTAQRLEGILNLDRDLEKIQLQIENQLLKYFQVYWAVMPWFEEEESPEEALAGYREIIGETELYHTISEFTKHVNKILGKNQEKSKKYRDFSIAYSLLLELTEKLLGARKSIREFEQLEQKGRKCSLCGEFEVLPLDWEKLRSKEKGLVKENERLCGVCLAKRLFPKIMKEELNLSEELKFPSTSEMATIGEKRRIAENKEFIAEFKELFKEFKQKLMLPNTVSVPKLKDNQLFEIDGQWLMKESYREEYIKSEYTENFEIEDFQNMVQKITKLLEAYKINPSRYYAILQMDGDHMGKWLKGENNPSIMETLHPKVGEHIKQHAKDNPSSILYKKHPTTPSLHQTLSRKISTFALQEVRRIVEEKHYGKLVYAGGDDVLALLPVEEVLGCAYELQNAFKKVLSSEASMSAGIVIVHHKYPLYLALKEVQLAQKKAKDERQYNRDAFCLKFIKGSEALKECGGKWELIDFLKELIEHFKKEEFSSTFPYQFFEVVDRLYDDRNKEQVIGILRNELKRIFIRQSRNRNALEKYTDEILLPKFDEIISKTPNGVMNFANMLIIARSIAMEHSCNE
ncbi:type III-B CRISPR-associated protein Cas10/Cmr2 [Caldanaerobacter subterraneus]|uniref:CRISPR-associated Cmr2 family protein n=1 Tax=Caldanaerobacter subterraneus TaxID=911092 RepID=A0A4R2KAQ3_9THEO|nr:type III-B CRISPR-associated protein Cas10/Cmr2 [Caldanaerobacter subterraneus]TCO63545.1 CRISPR-associated Cmr2 family protein [Caldanaerobacter subterraneus]